MSKKILVDIAQLGWLAASVVVNHIYHLYASKSEAVSIAYTVVTIGGIFAIGQLRRLKG